jgi:hypothetical protein
MLFSGSGAAMLPAAGEVSGAGELGGRDMPLLNTRSCISKRSALDSR